MDCLRLSERTSNSGQQSNSQEHLLTTYSWSDEMKYILLVHHNEETFSRLSEVEQRKMREDSVKLANQIHSEGQYLDAAPLHPTAQTISVRVRDGKPIVTDGPFIETREHLGGYFLVDVKNPDEAIGIASRIPGARLGTIEIRPVMLLPGLPTV